MFNETYVIMNDNIFIIVGRAVCRNGSPNDDHNVGSSSTSENSTHSSELAIPIPTIHAPPFQYSRVTSNLRNLFKPYGTGKARGRSVTSPHR